ncbi:MAG: hypothetical protein COB36_00375 [Alphaproteobacteria bacterium]|nr:MAG: hypothetical protein COB36_00375 [Alphaproteobacteria bacterium]
MSLILLSNLIAPLTAFAEESIPIPPRRPDVLSVSPAYIEELRNRAKNPDVYRPASQDTFINENLEREIAQIDRTELFRILEPNHRLATLAPTPPHKPSLNAIEPAAQDDGPETTLVSFTLNPKQITLDKNLRYFLEKHALRILNEDKNLEIHIHAYATPIAGEAYSDVRLSLARALEIRSFLIDKKIEASRLKLTPVGHDKENGSNDRIDLIFRAKD